MSRTLLACLACVLAAQAAASNPAGAQSPPIPPDSTGVVVSRASPGTFYRIGDAAILGGALAVAAVMSRSDQRIEDHLTAVAARNGWYHEIATYGQSVGGAFPITLSAGMFVVGKVAHARKLADLGKWGIEAAVLTTATTWLVKGVAGRARPYAAAGNVTSFKLGRGFTSDAYASFPSGHTSAAFAMAAVLSKGTADRSRRTHLVVSGLAYTTATIIGISRIYANEHWPSDVVLGAAIGTISGLAVVRASSPVRRVSGASSLAYVRDHASIMPMPRGGMMLSYSVW